MRAAKDHLVARIEVSAGIGIHQDEKGEAVSKRDEPLWNVPEGSFRPRNLLLGAAIPIVIVGISALLLLLL